jgi:transcription antitermination protein NusB
MISRRIIRVKIMQSLYAIHSSENQSINIAEKELFFSLNKTYDLYHLLMQLFVEVGDYAENRIEQNLLKKVPTYEDLNPNRRFVNNQIYLLLKNNVTLQKYIEVNKITWVNYPELIKLFYNELTQSEPYLQYMSADNVSLKDDRNLAEYFFAGIMAPSEELYNVLEEQSIFWNDDIEFVLSMIVKTILKFKQSSTETKPLLPLFKDEEDRDFAKNLFRRSVLNSKEHRAVIDVHLRNWDIDRVAFIDVLIMEMAICEFLNFPSIPTKVTLNEYIDLAKYYSTEKSRNFVNGILDRILKSLQEEGKVQKAGRGLRGENE